MKMVMTMSAARHDLYVETDTGSGTFDLSVCSVEEREGVIRMVIDMLRSKGFFKGER